MTVPDLEVDTEEQIRPKEPVRPKVIRWLITAAILIPLIWSVAGLEISIDRIIQAPGQVWNLVTGLFPPDFTNSGRIVTKLLESVYIAWIGTVIGALFSFPLAFAAATNVSPRWLSVPIRGILSGIRAFPELILAIILINPFGLGAFTGAIAIGLHSIGTLGKLSSEVIEGIDEGPREAIQSAGGSLGEEIRFAIIPRRCPPSSPTGSSGSRSMSGLPRCSVWSAPAALAPRSSPGSDFQTTGRERAPPSSPRSWSC